MDLHARVHAGIVGRLILSTMQSNTLRSIVVALGLLAGLSWIWFSSTDRGEAMARGEEAEAGGGPEAETTALQLGAGVVTEERRRVPFTRPEKAVSGESGAPEVLEVHTVDENGRSLAGVRLDARLVDGVHALGETDENGHALVPFPRDGWGELLATRSGYAPARHNPHWSHRREVTMTLVGGETLEGRVVLLDGTPVESGVHVVAFPMERERPMYLQPSEWMFQDPQARSAETDAEGIYRLGDLDPAEHYTLFAGGKGYVLDGPVVDVHAGDEVPDLVVRPGYGALVQLRDPDGSSPEMDRYVGAGVGMSARFLNGEARFVKNNSMSSLLAGYPHDSSSLQPWDNLFVAMTDEPVAHVVLDFAMHPPGYAPVEMQITLQPLTEGMHVVDVLLTPLASERGTIIVERDPDLYVEEDTRWQPFAILSIRGDEGKLWSYPLHGADEVRHSVENVPFGRYQASVVLRPSFYNVPDRGEELWIEVGPDPVVIPWGKPELGRLSFVPAEDQVSGRSAPFEVWLVAGEGMEGGRGQSFSFRHPPYSVPFLTPGIYTAFFPGSEELLPQTLELEPGENEVVLLEGM